MLAALSVIFWHFGMAIMLTTQNKGYLCWQRVDRQEVNLAKEVAGSEQ